MGKGNQYLSENLFLPAKGHWCLWGIVNNDDYSVRMVGVIQLSVGTVMAETVYFREETGKDYTALEFVHNGKVYRREWPIIFSRRFIITLAKRMVADITGKPWINPAF